MFGRCGIFDCLRVTTLCTAAIAVCCAAEPDNAPHQSLLNHNYLLQIVPKPVDFNPTQNADLQILRASVETILHQDLTNRSSHTLPKKYVRGLREIEVLATSALSSRTPQDKERELTLFLEAVSAFNNAQNPPLSHSLNEFQTLFLLFKRLYVPVGHGETPARNLSAFTTEESSSSIGEAKPDMSCFNPTPSIFWKQPTDIESENLFYGFGRYQRLEIEDQICNYAAAKESYGLNPGFTVNCAGTKIKVKFAEVSAEPFATRIFAAMGYHADPTDYARQVKVRYDRRLLLEFNSRKEMEVHFRILFVIPAYTLELQQRYDPFHYLAAVILRDGRRWSGSEFKAHLFRDPNRPHPEEDLCNYRTEVESNVDYLLTVPANIQAQSPQNKSIGPWDFGRLDHAERRELRGAGLLAAWLGWFDTRSDNTRLRAVEEYGSTNLLGYFSDLGGVLGETTAWFFPRGELPNAFPWTFTRPPLCQGPHHLARPLRLEGYKPIAPNPCFASMTINDARWMARSVAQLTESQIVQALVGSGYDSAQVRLYTEKLISRRDRMVTDLGLDKEYPPLRPEGVNRNFSYNPATEGPVVISVPGKGATQAPVGPCKIVKGKLVVRQ